jgi:hypothetical protein
MSGQDPCPDSECDEDSDQCLGGCPDADGDGVCDDQDPCPRDAEDLCTLWDDSDVRGGGCSCGLGAWGSSGLLLGLLLAGLMALRKRRV